MLEGRKHAADLELRRLAWHAANIMNVHLKKSITVEKLINPPKKQQTLEQKTAEFDKLKKMVEKLPKGVKE